MKQNRAFIIGITGGVGSGKSTVIEYLRSKYNAFVIKADDIGNDVKLKGHECYDDLVSLLGENILNTDGEINKSLMAQMIFDDEDLLLKVNNIIHPAVRKIIDKFILDNEYKTDLIVIEAALLVEANYFSILNALWVVETNKAIRIDRLMNTRGYSKDKCLSIINNQHDFDYYYKASDLYQKESDRNDYFGITKICNDYGTNELYQNVDDAMEDINV